MNEEFTHHKHGPIIFTKIGVAEVQHSGERKGRKILEGDLLVIYQEPGGRLFVRPEPEFYDGRFTRLVPK